MNRLFPAHRVRVDQAIDHLLAPDGLLHDFRNIFRRNLDIADLFGIDDDVGALFTHAVATGGPSVHRACQAMFFNFFFESPDHPPVAKTMASGAGADGNRRLLRVFTGQDVFSECVQPGS